PGPFSFVDVGLAHPNRLAGIGELEALRDDGELLPRLTAPLRAGAPRNLLRSARIPLRISKVSGMPVGTNQKVRWSATRISPAETPVTGSFYVEQWPAASSMSLRIVPEETPGGG